ncbi:glutamine--fructose-6-phosphate transaminase (isomerizing) [Alicyclobacillus acidocaldarius]|uniref:Glutamine--fructose-6-phosphate aminotransferase [isomerizing] n=1 Tax=Alicyclobacillus acidocaldarius subsp. acidocaldarius (strain ATCC 27009 / DSM 446 / BCRC 14685 / JCM 5260 / KCTC 1825 / NBRC 15652 / NCIMB 11725 / NRRL B-14509 / 104-IA) TaxID=521098 RepID=C8WTT1_ALIAD|nr:glutamine--fructose-6-phosphate transaminase (isomerizing) [Alicyclobacillus acidocaldarius]ACV59673.1 glucosamine/fructose-6-phosphate aminotransferase, isomerizing [Alicyclobacillus acidocaldarius subsp. acidocaldarius DSM 446]
MCGIVGYIGPRNVKDVVVGGLAKLEYRGYDSAGVAALADGNIRIVKAVGRLSNLEEKLAEMPISGHIAIGHTRWATHGKPSDENAHPHQDCSGRFAIVHNGIVENYLSLREELMALGHEFRSETDTEVVAHLIEEMYNGDLFETMIAVGKRIRGAYALVVMAKDHPDEIVAIRRASPMIIGLGEKENFVASDIPAILEYTRDIYVMEDGEMAVLRRDGVECFTMDGEPVKKEVYHVTWDAVSAERGGYPHFMLKEIHEQPRAVRDTLRGRVSDDLSRVELPELGLQDEDIRAIDRIHIVACGTSWHAGLVGKAAIEAFARIPVNVEIASEYRYSDPIVTDNTLVIAITQSGETADTLAAMREMKKRGVRVVAITNVVGSSAAREADSTIITWAGPEIAVASTKAYTTQLVALYLLAVRFGLSRGTLAEEKAREVLAALDNLPQVVEQVLDTAPQIESFAKRYKDAHDTFFIGRGIDYAVSLEGALKLKEISYIHAEAYAAGELKHGTLALITDGVPVIALAMQPELYEKTLSNIVEVKARGAFVLGLTWVGNEDLEKTVDEVIYLPKTMPLLAPVAAVIPLQLLAYYAAVARGNDVDKPRNLAKSVTVE